MADDPPALEQHHCDVGANFVRIDRLKKVGTFTQALYDEAKKNGWTVISMKNDWKVIVPFEGK